MVRKITKVIFSLFSLLAFMAGVLTLFYAAGIPGRYNLYSASAVQATQVYSEATYSVLLALGYLLTAVFIQLLIYFDAAGEKSQIQSMSNEVHETRIMVGRIGGFLQKNKQL